MELVSVIIPAYNSENVIEKCLNSVVNQTYRELEIIVIDDGSSDQTLQIAMRHREADSRIVVYHKENGGVSSARNLGMEKAQGNYISFVDSDDYIEPTMMEVMHKEYSKDEQVDVVICNYSMRELDDEISSHKRAYLARNQAICGLFYRNSYQGFSCNKLFRANLIKESGIKFDEEIYICEDLLFCFQYFKHIRQAAYCDEKFYHYVIGKNTATASDKFNAKRYTMLDAFEKIELLSYDIEDPKVLQAVNGQLATTCMVLARMTLQNRDDSRQSSMKRIFRGMRKTGWVYLISDWQLKFKIAFIPFKIISILQ